MSTTTANMGLTVPAVGDTDYPTSVSSSMSAIDAHDHTSGKGVQIPTSGIEDVAVTAAKLASNAVTTAKILDANVTRAKLVAVGQQISASDSGSFSSTNSAATDVTNLSVSITTTGRPVFIGLIANTTGSYVGWTTSSPVSPPVPILHFVRDSTTLVNQWFGGIQDVDMNLPPGSFWHLDVPSAGTYTYKVQVSNAGATEPISVVECKLLAYEL